MRQKRQDALCVMQDRLEGARKPGDALAAQLQQSEAQRAALLQQATRMQGLLLAAEADTAVLVTSGQAAAAAAVNSLSSDMPAMLPQMHLLLGDRTCLLPVHSLWCSSGVGKL